MKNKTDSLVSDRALFGRLIVAAQHRKIDLNKLLCHEFAKYPLSLADNQGSMRKCAKSSLAVELEKEISGGVPLHPEEPDGLTTYIIDAMALIQKTKAQPGQNFGEYSKRIFHKVQSLLRQYHHVDLVFDLYDESASIKTVSVINGGQINDGGDVIIHSDETPIPNWKRFMSNEGNKVHLVSNLQTQALTLGEGKTLMIGGGSVDPRHACQIKDGLGDLFPELESDQEKADTRMLLHCKHAIETCSEVTINSPDTDVMVITIYHHRKIKQSWRAEVPPLCGSILEPESRIDMYHYTSK